LVRLLSVTTTIERPLWRHHDFRQLWIGESISQAGSQLTQLALPVLAVTVLGAGARQMGLLAAAETLAFLLVGLPAGAWVDRWRKQWVLIGGDLARVLAFGSIPVAWWLDLLGLPQVYLVAVIGGTATVFFDVAYQSYLPALVSSAQLVDGNAKLQASESVMMVGGPAVGGLLLRVLSAPALIAADALSYLCSALFVARIRRVEVAPPRENRRPLRLEIAEGLGFVLRHPLLSRIAACTSISNLFSSIGFALMVLYQLRILGFDTSTVGLTFTLMAIGGLLGAVGTRWLTALVGEGRIIPLSILASSACAFTVPLAAQVSAHWARLTLVALGGAALSAGSVIYNITQVSFRQRLCPEALLGRMNASIRFLVWGVMPIGGLISGALGGWIGIVPTLWVAAIGGLLAVAPVLFSPLIRLRVLPTGSTMPV
jgi:Na+/melibiose symporter-like transporter